MLWLLFINNYQRIERGLAIDKYDDTIDAGLDKLGVFYASRGSCSSENFDYAIDMYLEGLKLSRCPGRCHAPCGSWP